MWSVSIVLATIGGLVAAILFHRKMEARREKKYVRECRRQHQPTQQHPLPKIQEILVRTCDPDGPDYDGMYADLIAYTEHLRKQSKP